MSTYLFQLCNLLIQLLNFRYVFRIISIFWPETWIYDVVEVLFWRNHIWTFCSINGVRTWSSWLNFGIRTVSHALRLFYLFRSVFLCCFSKIRHLSFLVVVCAGFVVGFACVAEIWIGHVSPCVDIILYHAHCSVDTSFWFWIHFLTLIFFFYS